MGMASGIFSDAAGEPKPFDFQSIKRPVLLAPFGDTSPVVPNPLRTLGNLLSSPSTSRRRLEVNTQSTICVIVRRCNMGEK